MYSDDVWQRISASLPLAGVANGDLTLLHRHWMWAHQQRERPIDASMYLADKAGGSMVVWYGLLWSVIEALHHDRGIRFCDPLGSDIEEISDPLRKCRNAVLHVPRDGDYFDKRILDLMAHPDSVRLIYDVHGALGRLLLEEVRQRMAAASSE